MRQLLKEAHLYAVTADYRKHNSNKPVYYVAATSAKTAKEKFKSRISWLDIYAVEEVVEADRKEKIISHPEKYICF